MLLRSLDGSSTSQSEYPPTIILSILFTKMSRQGPRPPRFGGGDLERLANERRAVLVPMGQVNFVAFNQLPAIGTWDLMGCSVVLVVSQFGAILAHIPPQPQATLDPNAGDANVLRMMNQVRNLHIQYSALFPLATTSIVCAVYGGQVALPDQLEIMRRKFSEMGYTPLIQYYHVPTNVSQPGQGTVVARILPGHTTPTVFVQDRPVFQVQ
ncbi:hypothetical protein BJX70DRAFT_352654 [Aspergillus crustosus]